MSTKTSHNEINIHLGKRQKAARETAGDDEQQQVERQISHRRSGAADDDRTSNSTSIKQDLITQISSAHVFKNAWTQSLQAEMSQKHRFPCNLTTVWRRRSCWKLCQMSGSRLNFVPVCHTTGRRGQSCFASASYALRRSLGLSGNQTATTWFFPASKAVSQSASQSVSQSVSLQTSAKLVQRFLSKIFLTMQIFLHYQSCFLSFCLTSEQHILGHCPPGLFSVLIIPELHDKTLNFTWVYCELWAEMRLEIPSRPDRRKSRYQSESNQSLKSGKDCQKIFLVMKRTTMDGFGASL